MADANSSPNNNSQQAPETTSPQQLEEQKPKLSSRVTQRLADNEKTRRLYDLLNGLPSKLGGPPETPSTQNLQAPRGLHFGLAVVQTLLMCFFFAYLFGLVIGMFFLSIDVASGDCGQKVWKVSSEEACNAKVYARLFFGIDLRCWRDKPADMDQGDFDGVCGEKVAGLLQMLGAMLFFGGGYVYEEVMKIPGRVKLYPEFCCVESIGEKLYICTYFADVTDAKVTSAGGLKITSKALVTFNKKTESSWFGSSEFRKLEIKEGGTIEVSAGSGQVQEKFLKEIARNLPVAIGGVQMVFDAGSAPQASLLDGRIQDILDTRKTNECQKIRKPFTAMFILDVFIISLIFFIGWYVVSRIFSIPEWAIRKGQGQCVDADRPGVDTCGLDLFFIPFTFPLIKVTDYISLVLMILGLIAGVVYTGMEMPREYRIFPSGFLQQIAWGEQEWQGCRVVAQDDISAMEQVSEYGDKVIKVNASSFYEVSGGIKKPFSLTATFKEDPTKIALFDKSCGKAAQKFNEEMVAALREFKPGLLASTE